MLIRLLAWLAAGGRGFSKTCGNFGGWRAFDAAELRRRYGSRAAYLQQARDQAGKLVRAGYLLAADQAAGLAELQAALPADFR